MRKLIKPLLVALPAGLLMAFTASPPDDGHGKHPAPAKPASSTPPPAIKRIEPAKPATKAAPKPAPAHDEDEHEEPAPKPKAAPEAPEEINADRAMTLLRDGNARWVSGKPTSPNTGAERLQMLSDKGQKPFVTIITCSDSRIPVERVFDRGAGDLFVVRVAGNRAGDSETGTVEYGIEHLKTPVLLVMGHTKCGAVGAAASGAKLHGKVADLVRGIEPAVERAKRNNPGADEATITALAVKENVWQTIFDLYKSSPEVREMVQRSEVRVIGSVYDIATGKVEWMGEHPWQQELLRAMAPADEGRTEAAVGERP